METPARACGIDFGTSNSTVGWARPGAPLLLALEDGKPTLPSAVFFNADEDSTHYGRAALHEYLEGYEGRLMRALKSLLGSSLIDGHTEVLGRALPFRELLASFIGELKARAEAQAGRRFEQAVLGRPVHFVDGDEAADRKAQDELEASSGGDDTDLTGNLDYMELVAATKTAEFQAASDRMTVILTDDCGIELEAPTVNTVAPFTGSILPPVEDE